MLDSGSVMISKVSINTLVLKCVFDVSFLTPQLTCGASADLDSGNEIVGAHTSSRHVHPSFLVVSSRPPPSVKKNLSQP